MAEQNIKEKKLRILWSSNAPWSTSGYGQITQELLPYIRDEGYNVALSNFFGLMGGKIILDNMLQYPVVNHTYGSDAMVLHGKDFEADITISLADQWVLHPNDLQQTRRYIPWCPVDHDPVPLGVLNNLRFAYRVIAMSKHGQKELARNGIASTYIPHTVNTELFKPMDKVERKQKAGINPDTFVVGMIAANKDNPPRKSFQEALDAFKMFLQKQPNSVIYIHSNPEFPGGFNFKQYADFIGIGNRLIFPDPYILNFNTPKESMPLIINTFDVLLAPSVSEGFAIPIIEALSCGVPVITTNFTAMPEHVVHGKTGYIVKVAYKRFTPQGSYNGIPDVLDIHNGLVEIYKKDRVKMGEEARKFAIENYDTKRIFETKWKRFLASLEAEVYGKPVDSPTPAIVS